MTTVITAKINGEAHTFNNVEEMNAHIAKVMKSMANERWRGEHPPKGFHTAILQSMPTPDIRQTSDVHEFLANLDASKGLMSLFLPLETLKKVINRTSLRDVNPAFIKDPTFRTLFELQAAGIVTFVQSPSSLAYYVHYKNSAHTQLYDKLQQELNANNHIEAGWTYL